MTDPQPRSIPKPSRAPVERLGGERYLLISLVSFAASVILTRLFLELTGYPQIGNKTLHIAHVLWGGLLLFIAALLPLAIANRWVYSLSATLSGIGVGLFIDEVGKFITQSNDYFYPPAAPIIYAFFLLTVLVYLVVRRPDPKNPRQEMYHALHELPEVLDGDLDVVERARLQERLRSVLEMTDDQSLHRLAGELLEFLDTESRHQVVDQTSRLESKLDRVRQVGKRLTQVSNRQTVLIGMALVGLFYIVNAVGLFVIEANPAAQATPLFLFISGDSPLISEPGNLWFVLRLALQASIGLLLLGAGTLVWLKREKTGLDLAIFSLILSITTLSLLSFYFDQFRAVIITLLQFFVLQLALSYRRKSIHRSQESIQ